MKAIALPRMRREETQPSRPASSGDSGDSEASEASEHRTCVAREMLGSTCGRTCRSTAGVATRALLKLAARIRSSHKARCAMGGEGPQARRRPGRQEDAQHPDR
eukprot:scaffold12767_cov55-Phaeocystis_antarctica.AAC.2